MPFINHNDGSISSNPVIGIFVESLVAYLSEIILLGFETNVQNQSITHKLRCDENLSFISLGPEGKFWDHFQNKARLKKALNNIHVDIDILLLRLPSYKGYAVWKYLGKPHTTILLFVGNPLFTASNWYQNSLTYLFRKTRSFIHDHRSRIIVSKTSSLVLANSKSLVEAWGRILNTPVKLLHTSSISDADIRASTIDAKFNQNISRLLFVGRICFDKGIRELLAALFVLNHVNERRYILDIVGAESDMGGFTLAQLSEKYEVSSAIKYHGVIPFGEQLFQFYRNADVFVLPSYHEGMPHAVWEAMSQGTPVISTAVGGVGDFLTDQQEALFINTKDSDSIVDAVIKLENDKSLQLSLIENGKRYASQMTLESQAAKLSELLNKHLDQ